MTYNIIRIQTILYLKFKNDTRLKRLKGHLDSLKIKQVSFIPSIPFVSLV